MHKKKKKRLIHAHCALLLVSISGATSDTRPQESILIGWSYGNECVKGSWGQTVEHGKRKDAKNDRREGQREDREADMDYVDMPM